MLSSQSLIIFSYCQLNHLNPLFAVLVVLAGKDEATLTVVPLILPIGPSID